VKVFGLLDYFNTRIAVGKTFVTILLTVLFVSGVLAAPSFNQLDVLNKLSPSQQQRVMGLLAGGGGAASLLSGMAGRNTSSRQDIIKQQIKEKGTASDEVIDPAALPSIENTLKPGDSLIVYFNARLDENKKPLDIVPEYFPDNSQQLYVLDKSGEIEIPGLGKFALAGLTEEQAAARINLNSLLSAYEIKVLFLPVVRFGPSELKSFGYDLFVKNENQMLPDVSMPVPENYLVGPGDKINIQLIGKENQEYILEVSRDSTLSLPRIGVIPVSGLTFDELKSNLQRRIKRQYIGVDAFITLGELRSIQVFVLGEVNRPGSYSVDGLSTMTNALLNGEGVTEIGSLRNITLKRAGKRIATLDLYDLLLNGDTSGDVRLRPGDVVHVPAIKKSVAISGEVRRPAIYELKNEKTLKDVIKLAGGLLPSALKNHIKIERIIDGEKALIDVDYDDKSSRNTVIKSGDILLVDSILERKENAVRLSGDVVKPGVFQWRRNLTLVDIIPNMRALKSTADTEYVLIKRYLPPEYELSIITSSLRKAFKEPLGHSNINLLPRDEVIVLPLGDKRVLEINPIIAQLAVQSRANEPTQVVRITGQVRGEGTYPLVAAMRISDLVLAGGRLLESAFTQEAELTRFETKAGKPRKMSHITIHLADALAGDQEANIKLKPYDLLHIKEIPLWEEADQVELVGEVQFPGKYTIQRGESLYNLLSRAGGLTQYAYPQGAVFTREDLRAREQKRLEEMAANLESELAAISLERSGDPSQIQGVGVANQLLTKLRSTNAAGRLVIDLEKIAAGDDENHVIILRGGDKLYVPSKMQEVSVIGQVFHPTSHLYQSTLRAQDYVRFSGGMTKKADGGSTYIVRANGSVQPAKPNFFGKSPRIFPGDTVVVPLDAERISNLKLWTSVSQILYQLGLTAAAWNTIVK